MFGSTADTRIRTGFRVARGLWIAAAVLIVTVVATAAGGGLPLAFAAREGWWLVMTAVACLIAAASFGTAWQAAGLIAGVLLIGFSAQLALTTPVWFQEVEARPKTLFDVIFLSAVMLQGLIAAALLARRGGYLALLRAVRGLGYARLALLGLLLLGVSFGVMRKVADHAYGSVAKQFFIAGVFLAFNYATLIALARSLPANELGRTAERIGAAISLPNAEPMVRPFDRAVPRLAALWTFAVCTLLAVVVFQRLPHVPDELTLAFQAKYFARGMLSVAAPPVGAQPALVYDCLSVVNGRWFAATNPGWAGVMALGMRFGVPWLVNPLLAGFSVLAAHSVMTRLHSRGAANVAVLLMAASPWFLWLSASTMTHTVTVALSLASWWLLLDARNAKGRGMITAFLAGGAMGYLFLTRPVEGLVMGGLTGIWTLTFLSDRRQWRTVICYGLGCIAVGALIFPYNQHLVGDPLLPPINAYFDHLWHPGANRMGFGPDIGPPNHWDGIDPWPGHSPREAVFWTQLNAYALNFELFGWGIGSLSLIFVHMIWGRWKALDWAMAAIVLAIVGAISLYWFNDAYTFGSRYWFIAFVPLVWLSVRGIQTAGERLGAVCGDDAPRRLGAVLVVLAVFGVGAYGSWRGATRYFEFRGVHEHFRAFAHRPDFAHALVIIDPRGDKEQFDSGFLFNDPWLPANKPIFARNLGEASNRAVAAAFPDRPVYFMLGRTMDGAPTRIVRGPLHLTPQGWVAAGPTPAPAGSPPIPKGASATS